MNLKRGFRRMYAVVAVSWSMIYIAYLITTTQDLLSALVSVLGAVVLPLCLAYLFFFLIVPWVINGFK